MYRPGDDVICIDTRCLPPCDPPLRLGGRYVIHEVSSETSADEQFAVTLVGVSTKLGVVPWFSTCRFQPVTVEHYED